MVSLLALVNFVSVARAQPAPVFVTVGAFADVQRFGHSSSKSTTPTTTFIPAETDLGGTAKGLAIGIGAHLTPAFALQLEVALPDIRRKSLRPSQTIPPPPTLFLNRQTVDYRARTAGILAAYRIRERHRLRVGYLGGVMFVEERQLTITTTTMTPPGTVSSRTETLSMNYRSAAVVGVDTDVRITSHVAIVPHVRLSKYFGLPVLLTRPGINARWTF